MLPGSCALPICWNSSHLARNLTPVVPRMAVCPLPHCVPGLACRLELASPLPRACIRPGRDHGLPGFPRGPGEGFWQAHTSTQDAPLSPFEERPSELNGSQWWWGSLSLAENLLSQTGEPLIFSPNGRTSASCNLTWGKVRHELLKLDEEISLMVHRKWRECLCLSFRVRQISLQMCSYLTSLARLVFLGFLF